MIVAQCVTDILGCVINHKKIHKQRSARRVFKSANLWLGCFAYSRRFVEINLTQFVYFFQMSRLYKRNFPNIRS